MQKNNFKIGDIVKINFPYRHRYYSWNKGREYGIVNGFDEFCALDIVIVKWIKEKCTKCTKPIRNTDTSLERWYPKDLELVNNDTNKICKKKK